MKSNLIFLIFIGLSIHGVSQTPVHIIEKYQTLKGWETPLDSVTYVLNNHLQDCDSTLLTYFGRVRFPRADEIFPQIILVELIAKNGKVEYSFINESNPFFQNQLSIALDSIIVRFNSDSNFKLNLSFSFVHDDFQCKETFYAFKQYVHDGYKMMCDFDCYKYSENRVSSALEDMVRMKEYDGALYYSKVLCRWKPFNMKYNKRHEIIKDNIRLETNEK